MRIVAGSLGGRQLIAPKTTATRPMTDKVRAALFDSLGDVSGNLVLDAYAGSGALGMEALSRGAERVVAIELARMPTQAIKVNLEALDLTWGYELYQTTVETWLARHAADNTRQFNLVVADPPYEQLKIDVLEKLGQLLQEEGWLIVSHSSRLPAPELSKELSNLELRQTKVYGDTSLSFYKPS